MVFIEFNFQKSNDNQMRLQKSKKKKLETLPFFKWSNLSYTLL